LFRLSSILLARIRARLDEARESEPLFDLSGFARRLPRNLAPSRGGQRDAPNQRFGLSRSARPWEDSGRGRTVAERTR
jgi:hypothetical protein